MRSPISLSAALRSGPAALSIAAFADLLLVFLVVFLVVVFVAMFDPFGLWDMRPGARCAG